MSEKKQSGRLTKQHKKNRGVVGIFGKEAKQHDTEAARLSHIAKERLAQEYPMLSFRYRQSISKEEINFALQKIDKELGQTLFVRNSSIKPDGGIIEVQDDNENPPFSLFREYVKQLIKYDKKFIIIGNINSITYKEIFNLIKDNKTLL